MMTLASSVSDKCHLLIKLESICDQNMFILRKNEDSNLMFVGKSSGLHYKDIMIVNDDPGIISKCHLASSVSDTWHLLMTLESSSTTIICL